MVSSKTWATPPPAGSLVRIVAFGYIVLETVEEGLRIRFKTIDSNKATPNLI